MKLIPQEKTFRVEPAEARWRRFSLAETVASEHVSAACYRGSEDIHVLPVVASELKFRDVQRQIFAADLVIGTDNAALEDAPEALNGVGMNGTDNVIGRAVRTDSPRARRRRAS